MSHPLVSVCLPNLNTRPYLPERVESILSQTCSDWELIVSDNHSEDGAWEFFQELARRDSRVSIQQAPREGLYANWNRCLERAQGKYVYIATSDDTMAPDCLEKLASALERHADCDLAHCTMRTIDPVGAPVHEPRWPECTVFAQGLGNQVNQRHVRRAPYDGLLHLTGGVVYFSITELLIRRSLFNRIGHFQPRWGSIGDVNWNMKAGLTTNTIHVPDTWATYRVHPTQATAAVNYRSTDHFRRIEEMIDDAIVTCRGFLHPDVQRSLGSAWLDKSRDMRAYYANLSVRPSAVGRRWYQARQWLLSADIRAEVKRVLSGEPKWGDRAPSDIRVWLETLGHGPVISPVS